VELASEHGRTGRARAVTLTAPQDVVTDAAPVITLSPRDYNAVLFDLDGVLTQTARVHAEARKELFDSELWEGSNTPSGPAADHPRRERLTPKERGLAASEEP
jgi:hypothetical protein